MVEDLEIEQKAVYKQYKLVEDFRDFLLAGNEYSYNTVKNYLSDIRHFLGFLNAYYPETYQSLNIDSYLLLNYRQSMQSAHTSIITIKRRLSAVNKFIDYLPQNKASLSKVNLNNGDRFELESFNDSPKSSKNNKNNYLITLLSEYVNEKKIQSDTKSVIREFLMFTKI
jgi:site-specific recombinase XerC